jgi:hypothetical protein
MKSAARVSAWVAFVALLCFAPAAFGSVNTASATSVANVHTFVPVAFLAFGPGGNNNNGNGGNNGNGSTCGQGGGNNGGGGWWGGGWWGDWFSGSNNNGNGGNCNSVPEGGNVLLYLSLAGMFCAGAMFVKSRRQTGRTEINS